MPAHAFSSNGPPTENITSIQCTTGTARLRAVFTPDNINPASASVSAGGPEIDASIFRLTQSVDFFPPPAPVANYALNLARSGCGSGFTVSLSSGMGNLRSTSLISITIAGNFQNVIIDGTPVTGFASFEFGFRSATTDAPAVYFTNLIGPPDIIAPDVALTSPMSVQSGAFNVAVAFSEDVTGLEASDFTVANGTATLAGSGAAYTLTVTPTADFSGNVTIDLPAGASVDGANNGNTAATRASVAVDQAAPSVELTSSVVTGPSNAGSKIITVTFSEDVLNFVASDVTIGNGTLSNFSPISGSAYTFTLTPDADGPVTVDVAANVASDAAGNGNTVATQLAITSDQTAPMASFTPPTSQQSGAFNVAVAFNEDVTGLEASDFTVANGTATLAGSGAAYTLTVTPTADFSGNVTIDLLAAAAVDAAGNVSEAVSVAVTVDAIAPTVLLSSKETQVTGPFTLDVTFSEDVTGLDLEGLAVTNGSTSNLQALSGTDYTVLITPAAGAIGTLSVTVLGAAAQDRSGNDSAVSAVFTTDFVDEEEVIAQTLDVVHGFVAARADQVISNDPNLTGRLRGRQDTRDYDVGFLSNGVQLALNGSASLAGLGLGFGGNDEKGSSLASKISLWSSLSYVRSEIGDLDTDLLLIHGGVDYAILSNLVVGVLGQYDYSDQDSNLTDISASGNGWLVGPYFVTDLSGVVIEARAAWGGSDNEVSLFGTFSDDVDTDRSLYKLGVSGQYSLSSQLSLTPIASVIWFEEETDAYTNGLGVEIPELSLDTGRATFGAELAWAPGPDSKLNFSSHIGLQGLWDFDSNGADGFTGTLGPLTNDFRARLNTGGTIYLKKLPITLDGFYDGIGAGNFDSYGVTLTLKKSF